MNLRRFIAEGMVGAGLHRLARRRVLGAILMLHRVRRDSYRRAECLTHHQTVAPVSSGHCGRGQANGVSTRRGRTDEPSGTSVSDGGWQADPGLWITDRQLTTLIRALRREGYTIVTLDQVLARLARPDGAPFACLTFDDGYGDFHDVAFPVLVAEQAPATLYVTSGFIDRAAPLWEVGLEALVARGGTVAADWGDGERRLDLEADDQARRAAYGLLCRELRRLQPAHRTAVLNQLSERHGIDFIAETDRAVATWEQLAAVAASPWVTIGGHTRTHPALALLPAAAVAEEMAGDRRRLEQRLGIAVRHFAYPYGDRQAVAAQTVDTAGQQDFSSAALAYGGPLRFGDRPFALPRIGVGGSDGVAAVLLRMAGLGQAAQPLHRAALAF